MFSDVLLVLSNFPYTTNAMNTQNTYQKILIIYTTNVMNTQNTYQKILITT